ncbi:hypothetical protein FACS1894178_4040 [Bacteroidia bacterium]|nr:hypothetical protein FACS1894178_4040 [Bacteroidia bacterium]
MQGEIYTYNQTTIPFKSTLSDANKRRNSDVFEQIYYKLFKKYHYVISDSRFKDVINKQIEIFDSTTITLFQEILKCVGRKPKNGKSKGGIKIHSIIYDTPPKPHQM